MKKLIVNGVMPTKSRTAIENPVMFDNVNIRKMVMNLENSLSSPSPINDIINYEKKDDNISKQNRIIIKGSALNEYYSLLSVYDTQAKVFIKNLKFVSSLEKDEDSGKLKIDLDFTKSKLPSYDKLLLFYPLDEAPSKPEVGTSFKEYLNEKNSIDAISSSIDKLSIAKEASYDMYEKIFENLNKSNGIVNNIKDTIDRYNNQSISGDSRVFNVETLDALHLSFSSLSSDFDELKNLVIPESLTSYYVEDKFSSSKLAGTLANAEIVISSLVNKVSGVCINSTFNAYLSYQDHGLSLFDEDLSDAAFVEANSENFITRYFKDSFNVMLSSVSGMSDILVTVRDYNDITDEEISALLSFNLIGSRSKEEKDNIQSYVLSGDSDYFSFGGEGTLAKDVIDLIMVGNKNEWTLNERMNASDSNLFSSSRKGVTMTFWTKMKNSPDSDIDFIMFKDVPNKTSSEERNDIDLTFSNNELKKQKQSDSTYSTVGSAERIPSDEHWRMIVMNFQNIDNGDRLSSYIKIDMLSENKYGEILSSQMLPATRWRESYAPIDGLSGGSFIKLGQPVNGRPSECCFRNLSLFAGTLSDAELSSYVKAGISRNYEFSDEYAVSSISGLLDDGDFYLGLVRNI